MQLNSQFKISSIFFFDQIFFVSLLLSAGEYNADFSFEIVAQVKKLEARKREREREREKEDLEAN